mgnify:CR=1 FL=1
MNLRCSHNLVKATFCRENYSVRFKGKSPPKYARLRGWNLSFWQFQQIFLESPLALIHHAWELKQPPQRRQIFAYLTIKKHQLCMLSTCVFHFCTFHRRSSSFHDVKWPVLQLSLRREPFNFFLLCRNSSQQLNSSIVSTYFAIQTTDCKFNQQEKGLKQLKTKKEMQSKENNEQIKANKQNKSKLKRSTKLTDLK